MAETTSRLSLFSVLSCFKTTLSAIFHWLISIHIDIFISIIIIQRETKTRQLRTYWNVPFVPFTSVPPSHPHYHCFFFFFIVLFFCLFVWVSFAFSKISIRREKRVPNDLMKLLFVTLLKLSFFSTHSLTYSLTTKTYRLVFSLVIVWPLKSAC